MRLARNGQKIRELFLIQGLTYHRWAFLCLSYVLDPSDSFRNPLVFLFFYRKLLMTHSTLFYRELLMTHPTLFYCELLMTHPTLFYRELLMTDSSLFYRLTS